MGFAKELNDVIFITVSLTPSLQRFFNTHVSGASEVNTMLSLDCIDFVSSSVDSHVSTRKTQVSISKTHSNFYRVILFNYYSLYMFNLIINHKTLCMRRLHTLTCSFQNIVLLILNQFLTTYYSYILCILILL